MNTDPIADYLTRVRNAAAANHRVVEIPASNVKKEMTTAVGPGTEGANSSPVRAIVAVHIVLALRCTHRAEAGLVAGLAGSTPAAFGWPIAAHRPVVDGPVVGHWIDASHVDVESQPEPVVDSSFPVAYRTGQKHPSGRSKIQATN